ncbi:hypothetical protein XIS1_460148 [Xenorhabdus innexi]|uniref:Uncharacterized protein n=1 Tax=Xenorhabdus innexi TaxID=290109 RepID=A0A1N6MY81_9GAMM|nr:hypothetical protein XIS1_460148 [Xenorhabdus innexi]
MTLHKLLVMVSEGKNSLLWESGKIKVTGKGDLLNNDYTHCFSGCEFVVCNLKFIKYIGSVI